MNRFQPLHKRPLTAGQLLLIALLWVAAIASALAVVASTQVVRRDINELETLRREASQLQVQWGQYLLEQSTWAAYSRVEHAAVSELNMTAPTPDDIVMVRGEVN
ncbi:cell division protein FtsL [Cellvibrio japonicus]|uniref:Cell division protein FtsL n=1 Tax=Cellvibrio japonicus (strain Ueda107) TaxID=498211 RepID=B3PCM7_CELJU|nr:cell division protein FtsL [Cellvibrio japonicus]ACE82624.1 cell division protein FtsL [Cellvibrio japonicus Ueda107]QEI13250.1 cell division protein FtsL [Cellvibrio japonicus]QEI16824.1 cell division protein FtsL [Cellvibrio japonicus]QEI20402.1 cell division protein FtsL [Cellvibrio japonicus]